LTNNISVNPRRFLRFDARQFNISGSICDREDAVLRDISMGGASFLLEGPIEINRSCKVMIENGDNQFHVTGRVAWARKPGDMREVPESLEGMYTIGVVFINTYNRESGTNLEDLIEKLDS
jgi:hypothetical protein